MQHELVVDGQLSGTQALSDDLAPVESAPGILGSGADEHVRAVGFERHHQGKIHAQPSPTAVPADQLGPDPRRVR